AERAGRVPLRRYRLDAGVLLAMRRALTALFLCTACSQSAPPAPSQQIAPFVAATSLTYVDPPPRGWRLVRDPASTPTRLLLDLVGPTGVKPGGPASTLQRPVGVRARAFDEPRFPVRDLGVYQLLTSKPLHGSDPQEPVLLAGAVKPGNLLTVGVFQKDRRVSAKESGVPLFQIALELAPGFTLASGQRLDLQITKARYVAEDIGAFSPSATLEMIQKAVMHDFFPATG